MNVVAVIDYGMGNLRSVSKALEHVSGGLNVRVTYDPELIRRADRVVFPGVGALRDCAAELKRLGLDEVIRECAATKPFLGICLGMQALLDFSEENGGTSGLGILPGRVVGFPVPLVDPATKERLKVPHMGWNEVHQTRPHRLVGGDTTKTAAFISSIATMPCPAMRSWWRARCIMAWKWRWRWPATISLRCSFTRKRVNRPV